MFEHQLPEVRHELALLRTAGLRRSATTPAGSFRRAVGGGLVRLGLRLAHDGSVPPLVPQLPCREEAPARVSSPAFAALTRS